MSNHMLNEEKTKLTLMLWQDIKKVIVISVISSRRNLSEGC